MSSDRHTRRQFALGAAALCGLAGMPRPGSASSTYAATVLAKKPVAYWRLGERHGPVAADASKNGHDGLYHGAPVFDQPGAIRNDPDGAVRLDGRHDFIEIADSSDFSVPTSGRGLTVETWLRPDTLTFAGETSQVYVYPLGKGQTAAFEWGFRFYSKDSPSRPNRISAYIWNPAGGEGAGAYFQDELVAGSWLYVVACFDPGNRSNPAAGVSIYRDGALRGSPRRSRGARYASYGIEPRHGSAPLRLGTRDQVSFFTGALDDIAIYPRVLGPDEIEDNYRTANS